MWSGFDITGELSKLGNQLGEALQKAKDEVDRTVDSAFKFDDPAQSTPIAAPSAKDHSDHTAAASPSPQPTHSAAAAPSISAAPNSASTPTTSADTSATTPGAAAVAAPASDEATSSSTGTSPTKTVVKKKIIRKVIRKVPISPATGTTAAAAAAATGTEPPHQQQQQQDGTAGSIPPPAVAEPHAGSSQPPAPAAGVAHSPASPPTAAATHAAAADVPPAAAAAAAAAAAPHEPDAADGVGADGWGADDLDLDPPSPSPTSHAAAAPAEVEGQTPADGSPVHRPRSTPQSPTKQQQDSQGSRVQPGQQQQQGGEGTPGLPEAAAESVHPGPSSSSSRHSQEGARQPPLQHPAAAAVAEAPEVGPFPAAAEAGDAVVHGDGSSSTLFQEVQQQLSIREQQLARQSTQLVELQASLDRSSAEQEQLKELVAALTAKNEQLLLRSAKVSEQDLDELKSEFEQRLGAAERKVFALTKERDALKKAASSKGDSAELEGALRTKEALVAQLMEEGEKLSKRILDLESTIKRLKAALKEEQAEREKASAALAVEKAEVETLRAARAVLERDLSAALDSSREAVAAAQQTAEVELSKARAQQSAAEASARQATAAANTRALAESEARCEALREQLMEAREALECAQAQADLRETMAQQELAELERRCQAAELRHQELASSLPEATRPLQQQLEALRGQLAAQGATWAAAEAALQARLQEAEAQAAAAVERARLAEGLASGLKGQLAAAEESASAARTAAADAAAVAAREKERAASAAAGAEEVKHQLAQQASALAQLREEMDQASEAARKRLEAEQAVRRAAQEELAAVRRAAELSAAAAPAPSTPPSMQRGSSHSGPHGMEPPAMAAPGFRWVLVREDEGYPPGDDGGAEGSVPGTPSSTVGGYGEGSTSLLGHRGSGAYPFTTQDLLLSRSGSGALGGGFGPVAAPLSPSSSNPRGTPRLAAYHEAAASASTAVLTAASSGGLGLATAGSGVLSPLSPSRTTSSAGAWGPHAAAAAAAAASGSVPAQEALMERFRSALKQKVGEVAGLEARVRELEATRDALAQELLVATQAAEQAQSSASSAAQLRAACEELQGKYLAAVELVGERDERLEEMAADLEDVKALYKQQLEMLIAQLPGGPHPHGVQAGAAAAVAGAEQRIS